MQAWLPLRFRGFLSTCRSRCAYGQSRPTGAMLSYWPSCSSPQYKGNAEELKQLDADQPEVNTLARLALGFTERYHQAPTSNPSRQFGSTDRAEYFAEFSEILRSVGSGLKPAPCSGEREDGRGGGNCGAVPNNTVPNNTHPALMFRAIAPSPPIAPCPVSR
jgi:hypothetical protein